MNEVTHLERPEIEAVLGRYRVGSLVDYCLAEHGVENSNYFLQTRQDGERRHWVLTVLEQKSNNENTIAPLLDLCSAAGVPVAPIVRNSAGCIQEFLNGKALLLAPRLPGEHPLEPTAAQIHRLGQAIAELHLSTAEPDFEVPDYPRDAQWLRRCANDVRPHLPADDSRLLDASLRLVTRLLHRLQASPLPRGLIHGDLFRDNVLFAGATLTGLLDFHHAAGGWLVYDLAVAANDWCSGTDGRLRQDRARTLLSAYHQLRPLTAGECDAFPEFMSYAALAFWLSRLTAVVKAGAGEPVRIRDPEEFKRISADRLAPEIRWKP